MAQQGNQPLPAKEANLFRQVVKFYETKQYKKAIKAADQVLKKFPDHGETLAMKGLTLNCVEKKEEAYELVRKGLKCDLRSHVCWHVYGLLYRSDREYREAIKCYIQALRLDKDNIQILRDLALLQIQMRDIPGFVETRYQLLQNKPSNRNNWIGFAIAHHINHNYDLAVSILEAYENTLEEIPQSEAYEHSEMLLYKAQILQEGGKLKEALQLLSSSKSKIKDRLGMMEAQAALHLQSGDLQQAEAMYRRLLTVNPDNYRMHTGLQQALQLSPPQQGGGYTAEQKPLLDKVYAELAQEQPHSAACKRIPLDFKDGDDFVSTLDRYVRVFLHKGIPSLFADLKPLYNDPVKVEQLGALFSRYLASLDETGKLPPLAGGPTQGATEGPSQGGAEGQAESKEARVWVLFYLAQHCDRLRDTAAALAHIDAALEESPETVELLTGKAKILRHAGNMEGAAQCAEQARQKDLADRYLNSIAAKAWFRAGHIERAEKTAALFTRDGEQVNNLFDMQHMWYEIHCGSAYLARGDLGRALKKLLAVVKHFDDIHEDQFDFHSYCVRKMTLRAYIHMLRMEDGLYSHIFFSRAAWGALSAYMQLVDKPAAGTSEQEEEAALAAMTPEERKKWKLKKKKEEKRRKEAEEKAREEEERAAKEREAKEKADGSSGAKKKNAAVNKEKDTDPDGAKLAAVADPLAEATKLVVMLTQHAGQRVDTHSWAFRVYCRKGRVLLALRAVLQMEALAGAGHQETARLIVKFALHAQQHPPPHPVVQRVVQQRVAKLLGGRDVGAYLTAWIAAHGRTSLLHRAAAAELMLELDAGCRGKAMQHLLTLEALEGPPTHRDCAEVLTMLQQRLRDSDAAEQWRGLCAKVFKWSALFGGEQAAKVGEPAQNGTAAHA